jgi:hypothetical protein
MTVTASTPHYIAVTATVAQADAAFDTQVSEYDTQIAPTILRLLGLNPNSLQAVRTDHTQVLPALDQSGH